MTDVSIPEHMLSQLLKELRKQNLSNPGDKMVNDDNTALPKGEGEAKKGQSGAPASKPRPTPVKATPTKSAAKSDAEVKKLQAKKTSVTANLERGIGCSADHLRNAVIAYESIVGGGGVTKEKKKGNLAAANGSRGSFLPPKPDYTGLKKYKPEDPQVAEELAKDNSDNANSLAALRHVIGQFDFEDVVLDDVTVISQLYDIFKFAVAAAFEKIQEDDAEHALLIERFAQDLKQ